MSWSTMVSMLMPPLALMEIIRDSPTMKLLQPPVEPLLRYVSRRAPVLGSNRAIQCRLPQPVTSLRFLPTTSSVTRRISPLFRPSPAVTSFFSFFRSVLRIPILLQPSRKMVIPFRPFS